MRYSALQTDLDEPTMLDGYLEDGMAEKRGVFDLYFRTNPFEGGEGGFANGQLVVIINFQTLAASKAAHTFPLDTFRSL